MKDDCHLTILDAPLHPYKRVHPSVRPSVGPSARIAFSQMLQGASYAEYSTLLRKNKHFFVALLKLIFLSFLLHLFFTFMEIFFKKHPLFVWTGVLAFLPTLIRMWLICLIITQIILHELCRHEVVFVAMKWLLSVILKLSLSWFMLLFWIC